MFWGRNSDIIDLRVTDDRFVIAVNVHEGKTNVDELSNIFKKGGALEVRERINEL
jgi:hypothetical protein